MQVIVPISYELEPKNPSETPQRFTEWLPLEIAEHSHSEAPCVLETGFDQSRYAYHKFNDAFWFEDLNGSAVVSDEFPLGTHLYFHDAKREIDRNGVQPYDPETFDALTTEPRDDAIRKAHETMKQFIVIDGDKLAREVPEPSLMYLKGVDEDLETIVSGWVGELEPDNHDGDFLVFSVTASEDHINDTLEKQGWNFSSMPQDRKGISWVEVIDPDAFVKDGDLLNFTINIKAGLSEAYYSVSREADRGHEESGKIKNAAQRALNLETPEQVEAAAAEVFAIYSECRSPEIVRDSRLTEALELMNKTISRWSDDRDRAPAMTM